MATGQQEGSPHPSIQDESQQQQPQGDAEVLVIAAPAEAESSNDPIDGRPQPTETALAGGPRRMGLHLFFMNVKDVFKLDALGSEVLRIAVPASLALMADPIASLIDTAFIGRLGSVEVAAVGISIALFNQIMKVCIYPLVSVTTSFVAEEDAILSHSGAVDGEGNQSGSAIMDLEKHPVGANSGDSDSRDTKCYYQKSCFSNGGVCSNDKAKFVPSIASALIIGVILGVFQAIFLIVARNPLLRVMGVKPISPMLIPAVRYLVVRSLGPAVLLLLAMQGAFRGFKDTKTPLYATVAGDLLNVALDPIFIFACRMGVVGAAIAHVISQYLITLLMLFKLVKKVNIIPPSIKCLNFQRFLGCGFLLLARVVAVTFCVTLAASLAARHGTTIMAAFQICSQVWLASSLLADGLAIAGQAILASAFAKKDNDKVVTATARVLQHSLVLGVTLTVIVGIGLQFGASVFTTDAAVIKTIHQGIPFVAGTEMINTLAFVFDGINFGASDYAFSAWHASCSSVGVAALSIPSLILLSSHGGFVGIRIALTIYMSVRTIASTWRMGAARGPWRFLRQ